MSFIIPDSEVKKMRVCPTLIHNFKQKYSPEVPNELIFKCFSLYRFPLFKWIERALTNSQL